MNPSPEPAGMDRPDDEEATFRQKSVITFAASSPNGEILDMSVIRGRRVSDLAAGDCQLMDIQIGKEIARLQAEQLVLRARFAGHRPPQLDGGEQRDQLYHALAGDELAAGLHVSPTVGGRLLALAVRTVRFIPAAVVALSHGIIDLERLVILERATRKLEAGQADEVSASVLRRGGRSSHNAFGAAVRRQIIRVDPEGAERRRKKAAAERGVNIRAAEDGMGWLSALLPIDRMLAGFQRLDTLARNAGGPDDERTLDQRRADVLFDLLMGRDQESVRVEMQVIVPVDTLLSLSENPGEIPGYGPVPAEVLRTMAEDPNCTWRRILSDSQSGTVVEVGDRRFPSAALRRYVQSRNPTCIFRAARSQRSHATSTMYAHIGKVGQPRRRIWCQNAGGTTG